MFFQRNILFKDRIEAGRLLKQKLLKYKNNSDCIILTIPRGGVVTAKPISENLHTPLNIIVTKKIPAPNQPELAIGAAGPESTIILDDALIDQLNVSEEYLNSKTKALRSLINERSKKLGSKALNLKGKTVILVDDGIATGSTVEVAIKFLRKKKVKKIVLAVPVLPQSSLANFQNLTDELVYISDPSDFVAVGQFYEYFPQVTDEEVVKLLK